MTKGKFNLGKAIAQLRIEFGLGKGGKHSKYSFYKIEDIYQVKALFKTLGLDTTINSFETAMTTPYFFKRAGMDAKWIDVPVIRWELCVHYEDELRTFSVCLPHNASTMVMQPAQEGGSDVTYATKYLYQLLIMADDGMTDPDSFEDTGDKGNTRTKTPKAEPKAKPEPKADPEPNTSQTPEKNSPAELTARYKKHFERNLVELTAQSGQTKEAANTYFAEQCKVHFKGKAITSLNVGEMKKFTQIFIDMGFKVEV